MSFMPIQKFLNLFLGLGLVFLSLASLSATPTASTSVSASTLTFNAQEAALASNRLGINTYQKLVQQSSMEEKNLLVSPISLSAALSLAMTGARGETLQKLQSFLSTRTSSLLDSIQATSELLSQLSYHEDGLELSLANSLWSQSGLPLHADYVTTLRENFQAEAQTLNFQEPASAGIINSWVSKKTHGKIKEIIKPHELRTMVMTLINATYFKADWQNPFITKTTVNKPFHLLNGQIKTTPLMHQEGKFYHYLQTGEVEAIELPYKEEKASMVILLPRQGVTLAEIEDKLDENLPGIITQLGETPTQIGSLSLPKFTFEDGHELKQSMKQIGLTQIFSGRANFSGISDVGMSISEIIQKTFIAVNEKGTEAAAVTAIGMRTTSLPPRPSFNMVVDRPFLFAIKDNKTQALLFLGRVTTL